MWDSQPDILAPVGQPLDEIGNHRCNIEPRRPYIRQCLRSLPAHFLIPMIQQRRNFTPFPTPHEMERECASNFRFDRAISFGKKLPELVQVRGVVEKVGIVADTFPDGSLFQDIGSAISYPLVLFGFVKQESDDGWDSRVNGLAVVLGRTDGLQGALS